MRRLVAVAIAVAALWVLPAQATDQTVTGKILIVKPGSLTKFIFKDATDYVLPGVGNTPIDKGYSFWGRHNLWAHAATIQSQWEAKGNPPGSKGYKYKGAGTLADPCKVILIKQKIIKAVCKANMLDDDPPYIPGGPIAIQLGATDLSERYCAEFGTGTIVKNGATIYKEKGAPPPSGCASPSGAFVDDSSGTF